MFNKIKMFFTSAYASITDVRLNGFPKKIILAYIAQLFFLVSAYMGALFVDFYATNKFDYVNALALLRILVSGESVLALGIICKGVYDADNDGVPDIAEQKEGGDQRDPGQETPRRLR